MTSVVQPAPLVSAILRRARIGWRAAASTAILALAGAAPLPGATVWLDAGGMRLKARVFARSPAPAVLVVAIHSDLSRPDYQYQFARRVAERFPAVAAAGLLRTGYSDGDGDRSSGDSGSMTGDIYTPSIIAAVAASVRRLQSRTGARTVILVGHSGGAAIAADVMAAAPGLVGTAVLVGCPCDLAPWRRHMAGRMFNPLWLVPVDSVSPLAGAATIDPHARVVLINGADDTVRPPVFAARYAAALRARGVAVTTRVLAGRSHEALLAPEVIDAVGTAIGA